MGVVHAAVATDNTARSVPVKNRRVEWVLIAGTSSKRQLNRNASPTCRPVPLALTRGSTFKSTFSGTVGVQTS